MEICREPSTEICEARSRNTSATIHVPIFGLTSQIKSQRRMAIYRNVTPLLMPNFDDRDTALKHAEQLLVDSGVLKPGDTYGITCGEPMGYPGGTNMLKVVRVGG
jgi:pyruvate kinase